MNHFLALIPSSYHPFREACCSVAVMSDSLRPHELQLARLPGPSLSPRVCSNSCPLSQWCHPTILTFASRNPMNGAHQAPLSIGFSSQEYYSGLLCPPPGDLPYPGIEPPSLVSPSLAGGLFTTSTTWEGPPPLTHTAEMTLILAVRMFSAINNRKPNLNSHKLQEMYWLMSWLKSCSSFFEIPLIKVGIHVLSL